MTSNLSPDQKSILLTFKYAGLYHLPKFSIWDAKSPYWQIERYLWKWSWQICQEVKTADYRKRLSELRLKGYDIRSFHVGKRHGYVLVSEPEPQMEMAIGE